MHGDCGRPGSAAPSCASGWRDLQPAPDAGAIGLGVFKKAGGLTARLFGLKDMKVVTDAGIERFDQPSVVG